MEELGSMAMSAVGGLGDGGPDRDVDEENSSIGTDSRSDGLF